MNGITREEFDHFRGRVVAHDAQLKQLEGIPNMVRAVFDQVNRVEKIVDDLEEWKSDSKVQHINALQGRVKSLQWEKDEARREVERDRLDHKRSVRATVISILGTLIAAYLAMKLGLKV